LVCKHEVHAALFEAEVDGPSHVGTPPPPLELLPHPPRATADAVKMASPNIAGAFTGLDDPT
jgi:hypothetical protein